MPFGGANSGRPQEPCIRWGPEPQRERAIFGVVRPTEVFTAIYANTAVPRCHLGGWLTWALETMYLMGSRSMNPFAVMSGDKTAMQPFVKILWPLVGCDAAHHISTGAGYWCSLWLNQLRDYCPYNFYPSLPAYFSLLTKGRSSVWLSECKLYGPDAFFSAQSTVNKKKVSWTRISSEMKSN